MKSGPAVDELLDRYSGAIESSGSAAIDAPSAQPLGELVPLKGTKSPSGRIPLGPGGFASLNPSSRFDFGVLRELEHATEWQAK